jgi:2-oxoisovalerate dehydrogenase E2 component (dihydrolipoyl transacylase)
MDFALPELGEGVYEAELVRWIVKVGDTVRRGQVLLEAMTDKATMEVPAAFSGRITQLLASPGQKIKVGHPILSYSGESNSEPVLVGEGVAEISTSSSSPVLSPNSNHLTPVSSSNRLPSAAPSIRHLARQLGIDLSQVQGSGPGGRILLEDVTRLVQNRSADKPSVSPKREQPFDFGKPGTRIKLQGLRRKIAEHMIQAKEHIPQYSYVDECDITELVQLRNALREPCAEKGFKLTYLAFCIKAAGKALQEIPIVNSSFDEQTQEIVFHDRYHVGFAVAIPNGLIVPVIHNVDQKDLFTIASEIERLSAEAKNGKSKLEDLRGGTFTVTSIGNIGGLISTPIVNYPEVGIMGVGKVVKRPVYDEQNHLKPADIVYLSFSFDHRIVDGAVGAMFGNKVLNYLQHPATMLIPQRLR